MPRPLRKRSRPKPQAVTIRRIADNPVEVVDSAELVRRKEEAESHRHRLRHGHDLSDEHSRLALKFGAPVVVQGYTHDIWWLVRDVNGPDRTITAAALIFGQPRERTFPFDLVTPVELRTANEQNEAARYSAELKTRLGPHTRKNPRRHAA